ncbi:hypothetical protein SCUCBS95973_002330 [Sporothrix curviconia]|uniref:PPM-type phosphatase domain-containing protein n=1 Tax=Sporothrix curviconia TaxID=1260050 RepID=A0ABP0B680_9PEZI
MTLLRVARGAAALRPAFQRGVLQSATKKAFSITPRRFVATKARLSAETPSWASFSILAAIISSPFALWLMHDGTGIVPELGNLTTSSECITKNIHGPTPEEVAKMLSEGAYSVSVGHVVPNVTRYDGAQLAANSPCEDRYTHGSIMMPPGDRWMAWGIFDGYCGPQMAEVLSYLAVTTIRERYKDSLPVQFPPNPHGEVVNRSKGPASATHDSIVADAMQKAFVDLDAHFVRNAAALATAYRLAEDGNFEQVDKICAGAPYAQQIKSVMNAWSGSCALVSMYDPTRNTIHTVSTGNSRAVLAELVPNEARTASVWQPSPLSYDYCCRDPQEASAIQDIHPGEEETVVQNGRMFGRTASRAFGDLRLKLPQAMQWTLYRCFGGEPQFVQPIEEAKTPPYLDAQPGCVSVNLTKNGPCFMIIASDGFWERMSNEEAVDLVSCWMLAGNIAAQQNHPGELKNIDMSRFIHKYESNADKMTAAVPEDPIIDMRTPYSAELMTVRDSNAAVHLIRNALGGSDEKLLAARLAYQPPYARAWRDDITVQVVFFNLDGGAFLKP